MKCHKFTPHVRRGYGPNFWTSTHIFHFLSVADAATTGEQPRTTLCSSTPSVCIGSVAQHCRPRTPGDSIVRLLHPSHACMLDARWLAFLGRPMLAYRESACDRIRRSCGSKGCRLRRRHVPSAAPPSWQLLRAVEYPSPATSRQLEQANNPAQVRSAACRLCDLVTIAAYQLCRLRLRSMVWTLSFASCAMLC